MKDAKGRNDIIISVHIRRGDVLEAHVRNKRLVNYGLHAQTLRSFLVAKHKYEKEHEYQHRHVQICFVTEQALNKDSILDFNLHTGRLSSINVTNNLLGVCNSFTNCRVHVFTDNEASAL